MPAIRGALWAFAYLTGCARRLWRSLWCHTGCCLSAGHWPWCKNFNQWQHSLHCDGTILANDNTALMLMQTFSANDSTVFKWMNAFQPMTAQLSWCKLFLTNCRTGFMWKQCNYGNCVCSIMLAIMHVADKHFSQWQQSLYMKAALPLDEKLASGLQCCSEACQGSNQSMLISRQHWNWKFYNDEDLLSCC